MASKIRDYNKNCYSFTNVIIWKIHCSKISIKKTKKHHTSYFSPTGISNNISETH